ncbi:tetraacyldisaccharide 4'-kinase [Noviherbaspirillum massiliense]|uniref:tetraacyldisaccharide 4'-kinase n=1 Tax=Noviherbaspirillum massiliense TaxID=1465823 RepID=UPI000368D861
MRRGLVACLLWPLSLLFGALGALRRGLYAAGVLRSTRLPVPVLVVGNIFIGGTGKTPFTIWLVEAMRRAGYRPGVVSRGYGSSNEGYQAIGPDSAAREVGDEPLLIARRANCPVVVGRGRVTAARALIAAHPEVDLIISDDGLQHYALQRDVEIVLFDARGKGNGWLLPAGPLREPASRRRDFTVVNAEDLPEGMPQYTTQMLLNGEFAEALADRRRVPLSSFAAPSPNAGQPRIVAAAGIGNPSRYFTMLRKAGLEIVEMPLPDHYDFLDNPFAGMQADIILITEKDAVKCSQNAALKDDPRIWVVPVAACIAGSLAEQIVEKFRGRPIA